MYISELEELLEVKRGEIFSLEDELDLDPIECKLGSVLTFKFTEDDDKKIIDYFKKKKEEEVAKKKAEKLARHKAFLAKVEELKKQYPSVTDERCFNLAWWPDTVPECLKDLDDED